MNLLLGQYARARPHNPEIYTAAIAAILTEYPRDVIEYVTDPRTGIARRLKWIPEPHEVHAACERRMAEIATQTATARKEAERLRRNADERARDAMRDPRLSEKLKAFAEELRSRNTDAETDGTRTLAGALSAALARQHCDREKP